MDEQARFQTGLAALGAKAGKRGGRLTQEEVQAFFREMGLNEEQCRLVHEYLASKGIRVDGAERTEFPVHEPSFTEEEQAFLRQYQKDMRTVKKQPEEALPDLVRLASDGDGQAKRLLTEHCMELVLPIAREYARQGVLLPDLVQEGNLGLMIGVDTLGLKGEGISWEMHLEQEIRLAIRGALEEQAGCDDTGRQITEKLNRLADTITELTEDMGRQVAPEELSLYLDMPLNELNDLLRIAGEQIELAEDKESQN